jgi:hypothetical protein
MMGSGGMRWGAGRPGWKRKAEQSMAFDVRQIARKGLLKPGAFSWHWSNNYEEHVGSVGVRVAGDTGRVVLSYQWTPYNSEPRQVECSLWIERTPCNYGGVRPWFLCPSCGRRCAVVYFGAPSGRYACRHCVRVAYLSQCDDEMGRLWRKQRKIERQLAGGAGEWNRWQKPKGMHQQTFDRLRKQIWELEIRRDEVFEVQATSLLRRLGRGRSRSV